MEPLTTTHWGSYRLQLEEGRLVGVRPVAWDRHPSQIGESLPNTVHGPTRVRRPAVRAGFLEEGPASRERRGSEPFVEVSWDEATSLVAREIERVRRKHGNEAIFGGSYGWSSAGRFHHAQSQVHRFLNAAGGYVFFKDTYSNAAGRRVLPYAIAELDQLRPTQTSWSLLAEHCELFVAFGGLPTRNSQVNSGGANDHAVPYWLAKLRERGVAFVNVSPVRDDLAEVPEAEWLSIRPGSDTALILALCHVLIEERLYDHAFVASHTCGFDRFAEYVRGTADGQPKSPEWAAPVAGCSAEQIRTLARRMAAKRTMVNMAWSLQRSLQGEQPFFALVVLTALLGQIGTEGGGLGLGYACFNDIGAGRNGFSGPRLPQGHNPIRTYIPVARLSDMLLHPGAPYDYDGEALRYPDIRLVYWAGGNAFHHHQDINKLIRAWRRPETVVVHEAYWTAQAKFSDIVLPATVMLERDDIGSSSGDGFMTAMKRVLDPLAEAKDDYAIFASIAAKLGVADVFTEGRDVMAWLRQLYAESLPRAAESGLSLPSFDEFWAASMLEYPRPARPNVLLREFRQDPVKHRLATPSGRIELYSEKLASLGYDECPGHPVWKPADEFLGSERAARFPLHMLSPQPANRLHSQYDQGSVSQASKIHDREPMKMSVQDASARDIFSGDVARVFNDRGAILVGVHVTDAIRPGVVQLSTGAWYDPLVPGEIGTLDKHGNPNVLTPDRGSSRLGQGCAAQSTLVQVERWNEPLPPVTAHEPPRFVQRGAQGGDQEAPAR
jgi:biotin/methionine sulfoxide reductase